MGAGQRLEMAHRRGNTWAATEQPGAFPAAQVKLASGQESVRAQAFALVKWILSLVSNWGKGDGRRLDWGQVSGRGLLIPQASLVVQW